MPAPSRLKKHGRMGSHIEKSSLQVNKLSTTSTTFLMLFKNETEKNQKRKMEAWNGHERKRRKDEDEDEAEKASQFSSSGRETKKPILKFVSGTATGKSFLINMLADQLTMKYTKPKTAATSPAVLLAAPTGLAALNIRGSTIHSLFSIEVQHGRMLDFKGTDFEDAGSSRELLRNVKLVIMDEVSMCSNIILAKLHLRLQQIKGNRELFGGVNIIAFGDLLQLPPVLAKPVFEALKPEVVGEVFGSIASPINLWRMFEYQELTMNMRQKEDTKFGEVMGRLRIDMLDAEDVDFLKTRLIKKIKKNVDDDDESSTIEEAAEYYLRILDEDPTTIALFSTNDEVSHFNDTILSQLGMKTFTVLAEDVNEASAMDDILDGETAKDRVRKSRIYQRNEFSIVKKKKKSSKLKPILKEEDPTGRLCGGLAAKLTLAENARVMLRQKFGRLVNGAQGYLRTVKRRSGEVVSLGVVFDGFKKETKIERVNAVFNVSRDERRRRSQFPLTIAYAATVHKSQGMTVNHAVISTRSMFSPGQLFVAFSRVRSLAGLHLIDFFPHKVSCHRESVLETNRLRATIGLPSLDVPPEPVKKREKKVVKS
ncbi:unnamed protein product [Caenorhabditis auriculariae]|uniref:ATP-dependent DNA helicase n=1 Tax=Caenorhabditis auriculariae TaxID=2777116 RepID=A0A8S1HXF3_9PELO|nr:unnamed protein product [Caenorhabditis auriculariae]